MTSLNTRTLSKNLGCCCGNSSSIPFKKINNYQLVCCGSCGLIRLSNIYSNPVDFLEEVSKDEKLEYWGYPGYFKKYESIFNHYFEERFKRIQKYGPVEGKWFDIGSGYGFWQNFLNNKNQSNFGIEIENTALEYSLNNGIKVELKSIEDFSTETKFSVITMCDVLEHLERPDVILKKCYDLLLPGGLLYIQVPNVIGFKAPYNDSLGLPHHLWQFEPSTLINILKHQRFIICEYWTGVQGIIKHHEKGGPGIYRNFIWSLAKFLKRGNRLQILVRKP